MTKPFRPLLSATIESNEDLNSLSFPLIASPKVDGIRVMCHPTLGPVTRSLKPVRNEVIRMVLAIEPLKGFDGEIVVGPITALDVFQRTTSGVMTQSGSPVDWRYYVFDDISVGEDVYYDLRLSNAAFRIEKLQFDFVKGLASRIVKGPADVLDCEIEWLSHGFEGVMLRHPGARYKHGRSTLREQVLMKLKRFTDAEATVIGFEALESNQNPQTRNILGLSERSDHKDGKVKIETLGYLRVSSEHNGFGEFAIGSGFDAATRQRIWDNQGEFINRTVTFKYQQTGVKDKPRFPIFKGFRPEE